VTHFSSQDAEDRYYMAEALRLARKGRFTTHPNPRVGCVLVKNSRIIGAGWHRKAGEPHAEVHALRQAGEQARGACAYVTLEPCSHFGLTPPCADALITAGVGRVVAAIQDPNPKVSGSGLRKLQAAGIEVKVNVLNHEAADLNKGFIKRMASGLPRVTLKMAMSLDGRTAMLSGESQWITGPAARADVQRLRAESSAVLTGIGTLLQDDAALTVRAEQFDYARHDDLLAEEGSAQDGLSLSEILARQPLRIVLDSKAQMPSSSRLLSTESPVLWVVSESLCFDETQKAIAALPHVELLVLPDLSSSERLLFLLQALATKGVNEILVEAGARLAGSFISSGLYDELIVYIAPKLMGSTARPLVNLELQTMADTKLLELIDVRQFGQDIRLIYRPTESSLESKTCLPE
jgi:diaminohydroxyphosphoribosylaminopyrimidine deaminase/5-amino-6-(5-phosphoribosylamino)uracil reductase